MILIKSEIIDGIVYDTYDNGIVESYKYKDPSEEPPLEEVPPVVEKPVDEDLKYLEYKLKEQDKKIFNLESENADLLLDAAIKDSKIEMLENDLADVMMEIAMLGGLR